MALPFITHYPGSGKAVVFLVAICVKGEMKEGTRGRICSSDVTNTVRYSDGRNYGSLEMVIHPITCIEFSAIITSIRRQS